MLDTQESAVYQDWIKRFAVNEGFIANSYNSEVIDAWLDSHNKHYSYDNLNAALEANRSRLDGVLSLEQKQEIARQKQIADHNNAVAAAWLADECPAGLLVNGDLAPSSMDKVILFIRRNFPSTEIVTAAMLSEAVTTLDGALDWFSPVDSPDRLLRNQPAPPSRESKLSEKAKREGGLLLPERQVKSHAESDGKFTNPAEKMRTVIKRLTSEMDNPDKTFCETLSTTNRHGRVDHGFVAALRKVFVNNRDGSVNWKETRRARVAKCDAYEKERNR
jgi:hypothetical protein